MLRLVALAVTLACASFSMTGCVFSTTTTTTSSNAANTPTSGSAAKDHSSAASPTPEVKKSETPAAKPSAEAVKSGDAFETRCGWFVNPTPGNAWLVDADGEWTIGTQGGSQAEGDWPEFPDSQWVATNGSYGHGCACMVVRVDKKGMEILEIKSAKAKKLADCRKDKALVEPDDE